MDTQRPVNSDREEWGEMEQKKAGYPLEFKLQAITRLERDDLLTGQGDVGEPWVALRSSQWLGRSGRQKKHLARVTRALGAKDCGAPICGQRQ